MDPRRSRSRARLQAALRDTLRERDIADVRIDELCRRAEVTRPTFYAHYGSVPAMLDAYAEELLADICARLTRIAADRAAPPSPEEMRGNTFAICLWFMTRVGHDEPRLRALLAQGSAASVEARFVDFMALVLSPSPPASPSPAQAGRPEADAAAQLDRRIRARFFIGAFLGVLRLWLEGPEDQDPAPLAARFADLATYGRAGESAPPETAETARPAVET